MPYFPARPFTFASVELQIERTSRRVLSFAFRANMPAPMPRPMTPTPMSFFAMLIPPLARGPMCACGCHPITVGEQEGEFTGGRCYSTKRSRGEKGMKLKALVGEGQHVMGLTLPFIVVGVAANIIWPARVPHGLGHGLALIAGIALLVIGVPLWITSVVQILVWVPQEDPHHHGPLPPDAAPAVHHGRAAGAPRRGPRAGHLAGLRPRGVLYVASRIFSPREERLLEKYFPKDYPAYRSKVLLPWL